MDKSYFSTRYSPDPHRARVWRAVCEYLQRFVPPEGAVLDVGAGYCDFINQIRAGRKFALDVHPEMAQYCASDVQPLCVAAIDDIDMPPRSIDVVMASNLLEHLHDQQCYALLDRIAEILTRDGRLLLIQPNYYYCVRDYWDDFTHVKAYSHVSLCDLLRSRGFRILRLEKRFMPFSFKSRLPKSYWLTRLYLDSPWRPLAKQMLIVAQRPCTTEKESR